MCAHPIQPATAIPSHRGALAARRTWIGALMVLLCAGAVLAMAAQALAKVWPAKPIRLVVPFTPGGVTNNNCRVIAEQLGKRLWQNVVVDNKPGASGNIGTQMVAAAEPDGYTLLLAFDGTMVINPNVFDKVPFNTLQDFALVGKIGDAALILTCHASELGPEEPARRDRAVQVASGRFVVWHVGHRQHAARRRRLAQAAHALDARGTDFC